MKKTQSELFKEFYDLVVLRKKEYDNEWEELKQNFNSDETREKWFIYDMMHFCYRELWGDIVFICDANEKYPQICGMVFRKSIETFMYFSYLDEKKIDDSKKKKLIMRNLLCEQKRMYDNKNSSERLKNGSKTTYEYILRKVEIKTKIKNIENIDKVEYNALKIIIKHYFAELEKINSIPQNAYEIWEKYSQSIHLNYENNFNGGVDDYILYEYSRMFHAFIFKTEKILNIEKDKMINKEINNILNSLSQNIKI